MGRNLILSLSWWILSMLWWSFSPRLLSIKVWAPLFSSSTDKSRLPSYWSPWRLFSKGMYIYILEPESLVKGMIICWSWFYLCWIDQEKSSTVVFYDYNQVLLSFTNWVCQNDCWLVHYRKSDFFFAVIVLVTARLVVKIDSYICICVVSTELQEA